MSTLYCCLLFLSSALCTTTALWLGERAQRIYCEKEMLRYRDMWDNATWKRSDRKDGRP